MHKIIRNGRCGAAAGLLFTTALGGLALTSATAQAQGIELKVLVLASYQVENNERVENGATRAFKAGLDQALVPYETVDLSATHEITADYLRQGTRARFQAVALPSDEVVSDQTVNGLRQGERAILTAFESEFGIREFVGSVSDPVNVGLILDSFRPHHVAFWHEVGCDEGARIGHPSARLLRRFDLRLARRD